LSEGLGRTAGTIFIVLRADRLAIEETERLHLTMKGSRPDHLRFKAR
jgi:hypothetical protein